MTWVASSTRMPASGAETGALSPAVGFARSVTDDVAEENPSFAIESLQLHLADGMEVGRAGVDENSRQHHRQLQIAEILRLPHDVLPSEVVPALLQHLHER